MSPLPGLVLVLLSLLAWTAAAQQKPPERTLRARRVLLSAAAVDVRVAPGVPTTLNFDADIHPQSVVVGDEGRVRLLAVAARALTLMPVAELGEAVTLRVRFADAALALEPVFSLRTDAVEVDAQVTAWRDARAPELLLAQVAEAEARTAACEAEVSVLRERCGASGPASWVLSGQIDGRGVYARYADSDTSAVGFGWRGTRYFLARTWMVVSTQLRNPPGQPEWKPGQAWLVSESSGERFAARGVALEPAALAPGTEAKLAVEFTRPPVRAGMAFRVEVEEADGTRHLSIPGVTVHDAEPPAPQKKDGP